MYVCAVSVRLQRFHSPWSYWASFGSFWRQRRPNTFLWGSPRKFSPGKRWPRAPTHRSLLNFSVTAGNTFLHHKLRKKKLTWFYIWTSGSPSGQKPPFLWHPSVSYLLGGFGAALGALPWAVFCSWASRWSLGVHIFGHVDVIVQQNLLLGSCSGATGERRQLFVAAPAAASAVSLQAPTRLKASTATVGWQEGCKRWSIFTILRKIMNDSWRRFQSFE